MERRSPTKRVVPGVLSIPGGHLDDGESAERGLLREFVEELGIVPRGVRYVCTLLHQSEEFRKLHYFAVEDWDGEIAAAEAEALHWISLHDDRRLDLDVDRVAVREYLRVYGAEATP